ncbi:MAG: O-antigen ligase family protein [Bacteroidales bacterium]
MQKPIQKSAKTQLKNTSLPPLQYSYIILLLAYSLITVVTPNLETLNSNGPKFLSLSLLNLLSYVFLLSRKALRDNPKLMGFFFMNRIGLAYTLFMVVILISFTKAINISESIISFSKYFTVFSAAFILSILLRFDKRYFKILVIVMTLVLVWDCITVFYDIFLYISKQINSIYDIKSEYSNKNILAAAIFVKIPFALWLATYEKGWLKKLGFVTLFCAELAIFFMSTRAFYLGLIFLTLIYGAYLLIIYLRNRNRTSIKNISLFFGTILLAFIFYSFTQHYLFPRSNDIYNKSYTERLSTIASGESGRVDSWKRSAILFKQHPIFGVGMGNWKVNIMKYENQERSDFTFMYNSHNDFIEITTETGIFGGLLFVSLFVFLMLNFVKAFFSIGVNENTYSFLFLPAFGILCYSFDAFFNFPADRAEMQSLFALFIGAGIAFLPMSVHEGELTKLWVKKGLSFIPLLLLFVVSYILLLNFYSLRLQRIANDDFVSGKLRHTSSLFVKGFPVIPNLTISGPEPIAIIKARYLINEAKYMDAINILRPDRSCPYSVSREHYMAMAYSKIGNYDSALVYAYKALEIKPHYYIIPEFICKVLSQKGQKNEAVKMLKDFLVIEKNNSQAWLDLSTLYWETGNYQKAIFTIDSAVKQLPGDSMLLMTKTKLQKDIRIVNNSLTYSAAMDCLSKKKYAEALKYLNEFISKETGVAIVYAGRAYCYYYGKEYNKCINDIGRSIALGNDTPDIINIRGLCFQKIGNMSSACTDFQNAAARGDKDAINNVQRFCRSK